jgi:asparagine synthase (glutamine-hydrolysing)
VEDIYASFLDEWSHDRSPVLGASGELPPWDLELGGSASAAERMMYCDAVSYLPGDILCKVDRASMACSLETRVPFLDHRVAALSARIPIGSKIVGGQGKTILRKLLFRHVPAGLFERPKAGFAVPIGAWLRGPLRDWAEDFLEPGRMAGEGWLDSRMVRQRWENHLSGRRDSTQAIWAILMFQAWLRETEKAG